MRFSLTPRADLKGRLFHPDFWSMSHALKTRLPDRNRPICAGHAQNQFGVPGWVPHLPGLEPMTK